MSIRHCHEFFRNFSSPCAKLLNQNISKHGRDDSSNDEIQTCANIVDPPWGGVTRGILHDLSF